MTDVFNIAIAFDRNLLDVAHVPVRSALANTGAPLRVHCLTRGVAPDEFRAFAQRAAFKGKRAELVPYEMDRFNWGDVRLGKWISISTMDRIHMPHVLEGVGRCLYLDIDTVVLGDVRDLLAVDHGTCGIAAKASTRKQFLTMQHYARRANIDHRKLVEMVGNNPKNFNAGVLWFDLDVCREQSMTRVASEYVAATRCNDQIALVGYANDRFGVLPPRWNAWAPVDAHLPGTKPYGVLHYVGSKKPWDGGRVLRDHWDRYATPDQPPTPEAA